MNITIPSELALLLRDKPNKSAYIAEAVKEKISAEEKAKQEALLAEEYKQSAKEWIADGGADWDVTIGDGL